MFWTLGWMLAQGGGGEARIAPWRMVEMHSVSSTAVPEGPRVVVDTRGVWVDGVPVVEGIWSSPADLEGFAEALGGGDAPVSFQVSGTLPAGLWWPLTQQLDGRAHGLVVHGPSGEGWQGMPTASWPQANGIALAVGPQQAAVVFRDKEVARFFCGPECAQPGTVDALVDLLATSVLQDGVLQVLVHPGRSVEQVVPWVQAVERAWDPTRVGMGALRRSTDPALASGDLHQIEAARSQLASLAPCPGPKDRVVLTLRGGRIRLVEDLGGRQGRCLNRQLEALDGIRPPLGSPIWLSFEPHSPSAVLGGASLGAGTSERRVFEDGESLLEMEEWVEGVEREGLSPKVAEVDGRAVLTYQGEHFEDPILLSADTFGFLVWGPEGVEVLFCETTPCASPEHYPYQALTDRMRRAPQAAVRWSHTRGRGVPVEVFRRAVAAVELAGFWEQALIQPVPVFAQTPLLGDASVAPVLNLASESLGRCYRKELDRSGSLVSGFQVGFVVSTEGRVTELAVPEGTPERADFSECVEETLKAIRFPYPLVPFHQEVHIAPGALGQATPRVDEVGVVWPSSSWALTVYPGETFLRVQEIREVLEGEMESVFACYLGVDAEDPAVNPSLLVRAQVSKEGAAEEVEVVSENLAHPAGDACVAALVGEMAFPGGFRDLGVRILLDLWAE